MMDWTFEITEQINPKTYWLWMDDCYWGTMIFSLDHLHHYVSSPEELEKKNKWNYQILK